MTWNYPRAGVSIHNSEHLPSHVHHALQYLTSAEAVITVLVMNTRGVYVEDGGIRNGTHHIIIHALPSCPCYWCETERMVREPSV